MTSIEDLCAEHRLLEAQAGQLLEIVSVPCPDTAAVAAIRWRMAQLLREHCAHEDRSVYERLLASGDAAGTSTAWRFRREHGGLAEAFTAYVADWTVSRIAEDWSGFGLETERMMAGLAARILLEERVLYRHAVRVGARCAA
jgi:hypothetical protein